ncbi:MAG: heat-inducible transcriptional repressor HrcA [Acidobacteriota bacterium]
MKHGLSDRELEILREVVELYLATGEAVASAAVARISSTGLSSPSIRNVMAELEQKGYLYQPHTSAGRMPSDAGLRAFVERVLEHPELPGREERRLRAMLVASVPLEEALENSSRVLADVTDKVGMAIAPALQRVVLRSIHFVKVLPDRVLAILVTQGGLVESRLLATEREYGQSELDRISNYCTDEFSGLALGEIRSRLLVLMAEDRAKWDELLQGVVELGKGAMETESEERGEVFIRGTDRLLAETDAAQHEAIRHVLAALADKTLLLRLLNEYFGGAGPRVVLGSDFSLAAEGNLGLIVTTFQSPTGECGLVGVIGSRRMDYPRIIPIVDFMGRYLAESRGGQSTT